MKLSDKQRKWIDYYKQGYTKAEAAKLAGYKANSTEAFGVIGNENFRKLNGAIRDRDSILDKERVADMEEINAFWTAIMRDKEEKLENRIKVSELRAKAAGGFIEKVDLSTKGGVIFIAGDDEIKD